MVWPPRGLSVRGCFRLTTALSDSLEVLSVCVLICFSRTELLQRLSEGASRLKVKKQTSGYYFIAVGELNHNGEEAEFDVAGI